MCVLNKQGKCGVNINIFYAILHKYRDFRIRDIYFASPVTVYSTWCHHVRGHLAIVSETKCSLLSHPDDVMKDDTANELESPLIISGFIVCISVIQRM